MSATLQRVGAIKGVHVPHVDWVVPFYPVVLEVLQELISIVKYWNFTLQATLTNVGGTMPKKKKHLAKMGHVHFLLDEMGLDKMG